MSSKQELSNVFYINRYVHLNLVWSPVEFANENDYKNIKARDILYDKTASSSRVKYIGDICLRENMCTLYLYVQIRTRVKKYTDQLWFTLVWRDICNRVE